MNNCDPRGVKRGTCLAHDCDCTQYEYQEGNGPKCNYCCCPPTKHQKLGNAPVKCVATASGNNGVNLQESFLIQDLVPVSIASSSGSQKSEFNLQESLVIQNLVPASIASSSGLQKVQNLVPVPIASSSGPQKVQNLVPTPIASSSSPQKFLNLLPKKLPKQVEVALVNRSITPKERNRVVRTIADKCFEEDVKSKDINEVAELAVAKWSFLKSPYGDPSAGLATQIKRRVSKLKLTARQKEIDKLETSEIMEAIEFKELIEFKDLMAVNKLKEEMALEMTKKNPSIEKLQQLLDATRDYRKEEVYTINALQILVQYPALKKQELLLWEFTVLINVSEEELIERWKQFLDKMTEYLGKTEGFALASESYEILTIQILQKLPSILLSGKRTKDSKKYVLQVFKDSAMNDIVPPKSDPPRLVAIGNVEKDIMLFSYVDGVAIFTEKSPIKAVLLLVATYWVFNIEFGPESRPSFLLISSALLRDQRPDSLNKSNAVNCLLKQLDM